MSQPFMGQLMCAAFNFAPKGWALCNGQLLPINQNQALFSLLGTTFGGDGRINFALPDMRGRHANSSGQGYVLGEVSGAENVTLSQNAMPAHNHIVSATQSTENSVVPTGSIFADVGNTAGFNIYKASPSPGASFNPACVTTVGGSQPHTNQSPYLVLNWVIALQGIFPSQN